MSTPLPNLASSGWGIHAHKKQTLTIWDLNRKIRNLFYHTGGLTLIIPLIFDLPSRRYLYITIFFRIYAPPWQPFSINPHPHLEITPGNKMQRQSFISPSPSLRLDLSLPYWPPIYFLTQLSHWTPRRNLLFLDKSYYFSASCQFF